MGCVAALWRPASISLWRAARSSAASISASMNGATLANWPLERPFNFLIRSSFVMNSLSRAPHTGSRLIGPTPGRERSVQDLGFLDVVELGEVGLQVGIAQGLHALLA